MALSPRVQEVITELEETRGLYYNLDRTSAQLLVFLVHLFRPRTLVEVGTGNGYSAILLAEAAQRYHGVVHTIERNGTLAERARDAIVRAGLQDTVTVHPGSAYKILKRFPSSIDFLFLDATTQEYVGYFERFQPKLAARAVLVADNMFSHTKETLPLLTALQADAHWEYTLLPLGLGVLLAWYEQEKPHVSRMTPLRTLVAETAERLFRGTPEDIRRGTLFREQRKWDTGYEQSLADEAVFLPLEASTEVQFEEPRRYL